MIQLSNSLERLSLVTPLGMRFRDEATGMIISDGLHVTAYPAHNPALRIPAIGNGAGTFTLRNVPGLHAFEHGTGDATFWNALPTTQKRFFIEVVDSKQRFLAFRFHVDLPLRGLYSWTCTGSLSPSFSTAVPLYSTSTRPVPEGMAVIRAQLWDSLLQTYAVGAVLEAQIAGRPPMRGFADTNGWVTLIFPYPEPLDFPLDSPSGAIPTGTSLPLTQQAWFIPLQVAYAQRRPQEAVPSFLDLCTVLTQPAAQLWADSARTQPLIGATLKFGQDLIVRSTDSVQHTALAVLFITAAGSPL